jgi:hypothetical protein
LQPLIFLIPAPLVDPCISVSSLQPLVLCVLIWLYLARRAFSLFLGNFVAVRGPQTASGVLVSSKRAKLIRAAIGKPFPWWVGHKGDRLRACVAYLKSKRTEGAVLEVALGKAEGSKKKR